MPQNPTYSAIVARMEQQPVCSRVMIDGVETLAKCAKYQKATEKSYRRLTATSAINWI